MAIALANQSAGLIGTAANSWNYTLGFTPTVGRQLVVFTLTPQASGAGVYCWAMSGPVDSFRCIGTRTGVTGSYNLSAWVGTVTSTSTNIGMFFNSTAIHGIIVAEFSGWSNLSPIASVTNTTTFTNGTPFSGLAAPGGRDLPVSGTNTAQIRSVISFDPSRVANLSPTATGAVSDISVSGTPAATLTSAPGAQTWIQLPLDARAATGTSVASFLNTWSTAPSGGQQFNFVMATGTLLNGQSASLTQLINPTGIGNNLVRILYRTGVALSGSTSVTASASSNLNVAGGLLGEKSLVTRTSSSSDNVLVTDNPSGYQFIYQTLDYDIVLGWVYSGTVTAGDTFFQVNSLSDVVAKATHMLFDNGSTSVIVPISYQVINEAGNGYKVTLNGSVPNVGGTSTWPSAKFIDLPRLLLNLTRSSSDAISLSDGSAIQRTAFPSEAFAYNYAYGPVEFQYNPSAITEEYRRTTGQALEAFATAGEDVFFVASENLDWINPGMQVIFVSESGSIVGPVSITGGYPIPDFPAFRITLAEEIPTGSQSWPYFEWAYLVPSTVIFQDFVNAMAVVPQIIGVPDPVDGSLPPFQGGLV